jgi:hypothetical protein
MGNFDPVTMDRWFMMTWGRIVGNATNTEGWMPEVQAKKFADQVLKNPEKVEALGFGTDLEAIINDDKKLLALAVAAHRAYAKADENGATYTDRNAFNNAAKNLDTVQKEVVLAPRTGAERDWIRSVVQLTIEKLQERGYPVNTASLQALVWYPEKELNLLYGVGNAKSAPTDYEQEFIKLARERGVSEERIAAARSRGDDGQRSAEAARRGDGDTGQSPEQIADEADTDSKTKSRLLRFEGLRRLRQRLSSPYRTTVERSRRSLLEGARILARLKPEVITRNLYRNLGLPTPEILELRSDKTSAELFHKKILAAKAAHKHGAAVWVYSAEEYEGMRLFMTADGLAGFALKGDDIVSVFKNPELKTKSMSQALIAAAVSEGGRRLDAFDTVLPYIYSMQGFRAVARVSWDDNQAPDGWNKDDFNEYNNGEPDVVYMVYDPNHPVLYSGRNEGQRYKGWTWAVKRQAAEVAKIKPRTKKSPNLMYSLPKESRDRVDEDPGSSQAMSHKLGATVEQQSGQPPLAINPETIKELLRNTSAKFLTAAVPRRYLADCLAKERVPSLHEYLKLTTRLAGRRNELQTEYEEVVRKWAKWAGKQAQKAALLSELMYTATLAGVDPEKEFKARDLSKMTDRQKQEELKRREMYDVMRDTWENYLDDTAREIYVEVRDSYITMRERTEEGLANRIEASEADEKTKRALIDEIRTTFERGRVKGVYFPLMRYGDYWAAAREPGEDGKPGEVVSFSRFNSQREMKQWKQNFEEAGYKVTVGKKNDTDLDIAKSVNPLFAASVANKLKEAKDSKLADEVWQMYIRSLPEMSMQKRFLHRKGRMGFAADGLRAYANVAFRHANQQAKLEYMHLMDDQLRLLAKEISVIEQDVDPEFPWANEVLRQMQARHEAMQNPKASPVALAATGAGFLWFLGFTPAAAFVNLTQTPLVAFPVIAAEFGVDNIKGVGDAFLELSKTLTLAARSRGNIEDHLRGDEKRAMQEFRRMGGLEKTQAHDLAGITERGVGSGLASGRMDPYSRFVEVGSAMFHTAEVINREATFLAAYRLAVKRGDGHAGAIEIAEKLTWDSHFDYDNANRPLFMQSNWGRVIFLFKQYSLNMTYRMFRDFRDGFLRNPNISTAEKKQAKIRFGGMMMMAGVLSGYTGLPAVFTTAVEFAFEAFFMDDDEEDTMDARTAFRLYLAELGGAEFAEYVMRGLVDGAVGITLSDRVSLGQLWWRDPNVNDEGEALIKNFMIDLLGPIVSTAAEAASTVWDFKEGDVTHVERGLERMMPKIVRDIARAYRYSTEGALTQHVPQHEILDKDEFTNFDIIWQVIGFTPARLTMRYDYTETLRKAEHKITKRRQSVIGHFSEAVFAGDDKELAEATQRVADFNAAHPTWPINGDTLSPALTNRIQRQLLSVGGVNLPPGLWHLYEELSFLPGERPELERRAKEEGE